MKQVILGSTILILTAANNYDLMLGISFIGRATIIKLKLNRKSR